jgi:transcriptional regulator with XRE-family HTH domain
MRLSPATRTPTAMVAVALRDVRTAIRWSQRELSRRTGVPQSMISRIEAQKVADVSVTTASRLLDAMGARLRIEVDAPFLSDRQRQVDPAHARMSGHLARRLGHAGWQVATEVEVGGDRSRGWIDLLAFKPTSGLVLVIEVKTEIQDLGQIDRTLGWYEREAWAAARRRDWRPQAVTGCLLLLMSQENDRAVAFNRESLRRLFPIRAAALRSLVDGDTRPPARGLRALAMVDPQSKRRAWLRPTRDDGRRTPAPYSDYVDFMRVTLTQSRRPRVARRPPDAA